MDLLIISSANEEHYVKTVAFSHSNFTDREISVCELYFAKKHPENISHLFRGDYKVIKNIEVPYYTGGVVPFRVALDVCKD